MAKKVKMADIATALNVSTVTVSKALSGQKGVSEEMRQRIRELASELGYQHSQASIKAERMPSYNIGVIVPTEYFGKFESFYWQMYQEVATESLKKEFGYAKQNKMLNVSFKDAILHDVTFSDNCDLSTVLFPKQGMYLFFDNWNEQLDMIMNEGATNQSKTIKNDIVSFVEIHKVH